MACEYEKKRALKRMNPRNLKAALRSMVITSTAMGKKHIWRLSKINVFLSVCLFVYLFRQVNFNTIIQMEVKYAV